MPRPSVLSCPHQGAELAPTAVAPTSVRVETEAQEVEGQRAKASLSPGAPLHTSEQEVEGQRPQETSRRVARMVETEEHVRRLDRMVCHHLMIRSSTAPTHRREDPQRGREVLYHTAAAVAAVAWVQREDPRTKATIITTIFGTKAAAAAVARAEEMEDRHMTEELEEVLDLGSEPEEAAADL